MIATRCLLLITLSAAIFNAHGQDRTPLACQTHKAGGLLWKDGRWETTEFLDRKFILVVEGASLSRDSVGKAILAPPDRVKCESGSTNRISCWDLSGGYLIFDRATNRGGVAQVLGGTMIDGPKKDTMQVEAFQCQPF